VLTEKAVILAGQRFGASHWAPGQSYGQVVRVAVKKVRPMFRAVDRKTRRCFIVGVCLGVDAAEMQNRKAA
jgi:hypothetical protein